MSEALPFPTARSTQPFGPTEPSLRTSSGRTAAVSIDPVFLDRWSPRSFQPDPITREELLPLFEAARWAPSANNEQPWTFVYALAPEDRERFLAPLAPGNRAWASRAPALVYLFARKRTRNGSAYPASSFDTGAAWMSFALQARMRGLDTHPMGGFDPAAAFEATGVDPKDHDVMIAIAVGRRGKAEALPSQLAAREHPSDRQHLGTLVHEGRWRIAGPPSTQSPG